MLVHCLRWCARVVATGALKRLAAGLLVASVVVVGLASGKASGESTEIAVERVPGDGDWAAARAGENDDSANTLSREQLETLLRMGRAAQAGEARMEAEKRAIMGQFTLLAAVVACVVSVLLGLHLYLKRKDPD